MGLRHRIRLVVRDKKTLRLSVTGVLLERGTTSGCGFVGGMFLGPNGVLERRIRKVAGVILKI